MTGGLGFHVSIAGGIANSVDNATKIGCTAFQIFTRNPRGWTGKELNPDDVRDFRKKLDRNNKINPESVVVHMPYLPNLSAPEGIGYNKSVQVLCAELIRTSALNIPYLVIHLGSHLGKGSSKGINQLVNACNFAIEESNSEIQAGKGRKVKILLENSAGQLNSVGASFKELVSILKALDDKKRFGVCLDTCHTLAAGYGLRNKEEVDKTFKEFDDLVGIRNLNLVHLNDSTNDLGSGLDRHEHVGLGKIGEEGFLAVLSHSAVRKLPIIMETPIDDRRGNLENYKYVRNLMKIIN